MHHISGGCHCGNITFDVDLPFEGPTIPVRACGCGFCQKHDGVWTSHPEGRLIAKLADLNEVNRYRFGHKTADFYVCRTCGVAPFVVSLIDGRQRAVVNVHTFEDVPAEDLDSAATDFEGESVEARLARRGERWIGEVTIET